MGKFDFTQTSQGAQRLLYKSILCELSDADNYWDVKLNHYPCIGYFNKLQNVQI